MKLNKKGYMLVEIIVAFSLAMGIAYYLLNLTNKFKNVNEDIYQSTLYLKDKVAITKNIMNDLDDEKIKGYESCTGNCVIIVTELNRKKIEVNTNGNVTTVTYGKIHEDGSYDINDVSYYQKSMESFLTVGNIQVIESNKDYFVINVPVSSIYDDIDYSIKIFGQKSVENQTVYRYSGHYETFVVPDTGWYKISAWGAAGGSSILEGGERDVLGYQFCVGDGVGHCRGGNGAYTSGYVYLNKDENLYIYVGGKGGEGVVDGTASGGYNGGGTGDYDHSDNEGDGGGGGASDIRLVPGEWNDETSLNSRIMVAAGGGGASDVYSGLPGGRLINTNKTFKNSERKAFTPSTQVGGYQFGIGQNGTLVRTNYPVAGGGGGYYGGISVDNNSTFENFGAGGSSFISGYAGVDAITSNVDRTPSNNTLHYSHKYFIAGSMVEGVNSGDGRVTISYVSSTKPNRINNKLNSVRYIMDCTNGNKANLNNHWGEIQAIYNGVNIAKGKSIIGTINQYDNTTHAFSYIVDGRLDNITPSSGYGYMGGTGRQCVTIDLDTALDLDEISIWHYWTDNRTYYNNVTYVSSDNITWHEIINKNENETCNGKRINAYK